MIYQINGEQPFQVLSDSFSVSPSESGYNLYLSADGVNYSQFATVAANTTRQFTGMNNGNYYILSGNTSDVQVNWNRDCRGGGGGAAGVSSLDGQTGALTTKTIGGQSILGEGDIPVGGGDGDYYIDGDNINSYSGVVNEIYHKIASGETVYVASKYDYVRYPVAKAEIYEYQEGQPGDPDYLRQEGFQIVATRFGNDGFAIRSGVLRAFRYEGRDGDGYTCGTSWDYTMSEENGGNYMIVEDLSAITTPIEGMIAYRKEYSYIETIPCYKVYRKEKFGPGGDLFRIMVDGNEVVRVYQDGSNYIWDWTNDGEWHTYNREYNGVIYHVLYRTYNDSETPINSYFTIDKDFGGLADIGGIMTFETSEGEDVAYAEDYNYEKNVVVPAEFYQYIDGEWQKLDLPRKIILDDMTTAERVVLFNALKALWDTGGRDFSQFRIYSYPDNQTYEAHLPWLLQFYDYSNDGGGRFLFGAAAARRDWARAINGFGLALTYDGSIVDKSFESLEPTSVFKYTLLRDRDYLVYINGTWSGYTIDATNVSADVWLCNYRVNDYWYLSIYKGGDGRWLNGDWSDYTVDGRWHQMSRDNGSFKCELYYRITGQTIDVAFTTGGPTQDSEMNFDTNAVYTAETFSLEFFATNNNVDIIYTGNTCSTELKFEEPGVRMFADGVSDHRVPEPLFNFRTITADGETRYSNPVVSYRKVPTTVLYDANGNAYNFNERFYFNYVDFTISLLAGDGNDYRYAQLTVTAN